MDAVRATGERRKHGFSLIEVMVALGILGFGLLGVAAAQLYAMRGGASGRHTSDAAVVAHSQAESFLRMDFDDLTATGGSFVPAPGGPVDRIVQTSDGTAVEMSYAVSWRIADLNPATKSIDIVVTWNEPQRPNRQLVLSTIRHDDRPTEGL